MKRVILTIEYDMGDYSDMEEDGVKISTNPKDWRESFFQSDIDHSYMKIMKVRIENE